MCHCGCISFYSNFLVSFTHTIRVSFTHYLVSLWVHRFTQYFEYILLSIFCSEGGIAETSHTWPDISAIVVGAVVLNSLLLIAMVR